MIAVIADDLTGAAEIGGIALRYGLQPVLVTNDAPFPDAEILIVDADSRSGSAEAAAAKMTAIGDRLAACKPSVVFKKVDSVLRGHVLAETWALMETMKLQKALIVPGNPSLGRTIVNGSYFIYGQPVSETGFSADPEFPVESSDVREMLRANLGEVSSLKTTDGLPDSGVMIGDVATVDDLDIWADGLDEFTLAAGGAGFFNAVLQSMNLLRNQRRHLGPIAPERLYVCGTAFGSSVDLVRTSSDRGRPVFYLSPGETIQSWRDHAVDAIREQGSAVIAIPKGFYPESPEWVKINMAETAASIAAVFPELELLIEGGSTAAEVLRQMGVKTLFPLEEFSQGVIRMSARGSKHRIILKPGSYDWPPGIWEF